jgi:hypothetical protein
MLKVLVALAITSGLVGCYGLIDRPAGGGGGGTGATNTSSDEDWATDEQGIWDAGTRPRPKRHPR